MWNDDSFMMVERRRTPMTTASNCNLGILICLNGATLHLPIKKQVSTSVAKLGTVSTMQRLQLPQLRRQKIYGLHFHFLMNGNSYWVLFNVTSGEEKYNSKFFWSGITTWGATCSSHFFPSFHSSWRNFLKRIVDGDNIPIVSKIEETRLKILRLMYAEASFGNQWEVS